MGFIAFEFLRIPSTSSIKGGFEEVAYIRNENNLGSVLLYYAFTVEKPAEAEYKTFGNTLPHNKHNGITTAFMFAKGQPAPPSLSLVPPHFDTTLYKPIAVFRKDKTGNITVE